MTGAAVCMNHLDREAIGVCVKCRGRVCSECVTKVDGINYCVSCLSKLAGHGRKEREKKTKLSLPRELAPVAAISWLFVLTLFAWGLVEVALSGV